MTAKYASESSLFGKLISDPHFWAPAVAMGAGLAATGVASAIQKVQDARAKAHGFKEMLNLHPQLKTRDQAFVQRVYSSLHNVNPMMARDPMIAGAWTDTIIESGGLDAGQASRALLEGVKELAQIRSQISNARKGEPNMPKSVGAGVERMVEHGFTRGKDLEREHGDMAARDKQIGTLQEKLKFKGIQDSANEVERYNRAAAKSPAAAQAIMDAVLKKYSADQKTPGERLLDAVR